MIQPSAWAFPTVDQLKLIFDDAMADGVIYMAIFCNLH